MKSPKYRSTKLHSDLVPVGPVTLNRHGYPVRTFPNYEAAVKALDNAQGNGWSI